MRINRRTIGIRQRDITDCGAACLASVAAHYGLRLPVARIRQYASTGKRGTNALGMVRAAEKLGFEAKGVRGKGNKLSDVPLPAIAHVVVRDGLHHYVVLYRVTGRDLLVMDPMDGKLHTLSYEAFNEQWTGVLILLIPGEKFEEGNEKVSVSSRLWFLIKPHKRVMLQALFGAAVFTVIGLTAAIYVQLIVDYVLPDGNRNLLNLLSVVMVVLLVLQVFIGVTKSVFTLKTGQQIDARLILGYYKHLVRLPQQFFDTMRVGEIISRINDAVKIRSFINDVSITLAVNLFIVLFSFGLMFTYYWKLGLVMGAIIPGYGLVYYITNRINRKTQRKVMEDAAGLESQLVESLNAISTVKQFGLEDFVNIRTETRFIRLLKSIYRSGLNAVFSGHSSQFVSRLFTIILLWVGGYFVLRQAITPGELLSFYAITGYFTGPVGELIGMNKTIQDALIAADRLFEIMDLEREKGGKLTVLKPEMIGDITFEEVHFRYGSRATVFEGLNLTIPRGKVTALVGESGSGKTTLVNILQKLYPPAGGQVRIGGVNLEHIDNRSLREVIAVVPQHVDLFAGSVADNIAVGTFEPDMEKIIRICRRLGMLEFIESLPAGFSTRLGEHGAGLSGGQQQRIALARALYRDPEILLLDEAASSLDAVSERYVRRAVARLRAQGKTVVMIAHRLATVCGADRICVLARGRVAGQGTHRELLARPGLYRELWERQYPAAANGLAPDSTEAAGNNQHGL